MICQRICPDKKAIKRANRRLATFHWTTKCWQSIWRSQDETMLPSNVSIPRLKETVILDTDRYKPKDHRKLSFIGGEWSLRAILIFRNFPMLVPCRTIWSDTAAKIIICFVCYHILCFKNANFFKTSVQFRQHSSTFLYNYRVPRNSFKISFKYFLIFY